MRSSIGSFVLVLALTGSLHAANLRIVGYDAVWASTANPSPAFHALIVNEQGATDRLAGWQLSLVIFPTDNATGVLQFDWADLPRQPSDNYLLAGDSATLDVSDPPLPPLVAGPADSVVLGDYALSVLGNTVPSSERMLLKAGFTASENAQGIFTVAVVPGQENSFWASFDTTDFPMMTRDFGNISPDREFVAIGQVAVNVPLPEPIGTLQLAVIASVVGYLTSRIHSKERR